MTTTMIRILILAVALFTFSSCGDNENPEPGGNNNTPLSRITISNGNAIETETGSSVMTFDLVLSAASDSDVTVRYKTGDASATAGLDYLAVDDVLTFSSGATTAQISVTILADTEDESDEQFLLTLSEPSNATISIGDAIGTIENYRVVIDNPGDGYSTPLEYPDYTLLWNDEFTSNVIDPNTYTHEQGDHGWGNEELQNYTTSPVNSFIDEGKLHIVAREESPGNYTSARIITKDKFEFAFGRVDIRAKVPTAQGIWPALWMLGSNFSDIGWPACGEIDIMELVGFEPSTVHGTAHYGNQGMSYSFNKGDKISLPGGEKFSEEFHVFSIIWKQDRIDWYMDDQRFYTLTSNGVDGNPWRFNNEFFFIFNVAVGGRWPGNPDGTTTFPQEMVIDYVRVFQQ